MQVVAPLPVIYMGVKSPQQMYTCTCTSLVHRPYTVNIARLGACTCTVCSIVRIMQSNHVQAHTNILICTDIVHTRLENKDQGCAWPFLQGIEYSTLHVQLHGGFSQQFCKINAHLHLHCTCMYIYYVQNQTCLFWCRLPNLIPYHSLVTLHNRYSAQVHD